MRDYVDAIAPATRPLFDRVHRLVLEAHPGAQMLMACRMRRSATWSGPRYRAERSGRKNARTSSTSSSGCSSAAK